MDSKDLAVLVSIFTEIFNFIKDNWSGIAVGAVEYEEARINDTKLQQQKLQTQLDVANANSAIDEANSGRSAGDIVGDAIKLGSNKPKPN